MECFSSMEFSLFHFIRCVIYTAQCIQASRISDKRQALGYDLDQECLVIPDPHIRYRMAGKLRFTAALRRQKTECDHLSLLIIQTGTGIVIAEAVIRQP